MTSGEDRKIVRDYVLQRELIRPGTNILHAVCFLFFLLLVSFVISLSIKLLFEKAPYVLVFIFVFFSIIFLLLKKIIIGSVEIYQHYMPEWVRRKCLCMPTCSEYMILAVKKYGALKGLGKGLYRLTHTCRGRWGDYKIDYP
jgi:putative component of membrane protein insertase Oxa1/YidC/SpoIIIJ protein YidD